MNGAVSQADLDDIWNDDVLNRRADAEFLLRFLIGRVAERAERKVGKSYVLNLDASWGEGKTFFLERFARTVRANGHLAVYVNAWRDDHADDPLLAVMSAIDEVVSPSGSKLKSATKSSLKKATALGGRVIAAAVKGTASHLLKKHLGEEAVSAVKDAFGKDGEGVSEAAQAEAEKAIDKIYDEEAKLLLDRFNRSKRSIEEFKKYLLKFIESLSEERKPPLFIFIDELDRCRPSYAIALLERIKHLFDIENVVFVLATDTEQLSHAVGAVYGGKFDGGGYLSRFFDRSYTFEDVSLREFVALLMHQAPMDEKKISVPGGDLAEFMTEGFGFFGLSLRDIEQAYDIIRSAVSAWDLKIKIQMVVLFPIAIGYQQNLTPVLGSKFRDQLNAIAAEYGRGNRWLIDFVHHPFGRKEIITRTGMNVFEQFIRQGERDLSDTLRSEPTTFDEQWVQQQFAEEYAVLHGSSHRGIPPMSAILQYPELVRTAGRLLPDRK